MGPKRKVSRKKGNSGSNNQNFVQIMMDGFAKIAKTLKKNKKSKNKRRYDSDSDSSWSVGPGSTGDLVNVESNP